MTKLFMAAVGLVTIAVVMVIMSPKYLKTTTTSQKKSGVTISQAEANAFGSFLLAKQVSPTRDAAANETTTGTTQPTPGQPIDIGGTIRYEFVFDGAITLPNWPVLKRQTPATATTGSTINTLGLFSASTFSSLHPQNLTVTETTDDGYTVTIDYQNGSVTFYRGGGNGIAVLDLKPDQPIELNSNTPSAATPTDDEAIAIVNTFLDRHDISRASFSSPVVQQNLSFPVMAETRSSGFYGYADQSIIYPWKINGQSVFDLSGYPYGLMASVSSSTKSVSSVGNVVSLNFTASDYALETDSQAILNVVHRGGLYGYQPAAGDGVTTVTVTLGQPQAAYLFSAYQLNNGQGEYLVPGLIFPVTKVSDDQTFYQTAIVVPLVKELLNQDTTITPVPEPLPADGGVGQTEPSSRSGGAPAQ